jgi:hypothetical protein
MNNLKIAKLMTGEEVIGQYTENDNGTYSVQHPMVFQVAGVQGAQLQVQLLPFLIHNPDGIAEIYADKFITVPEAATQNLVDLYIKNTTDVELDV